MLKNITMADFSVPNKPSLCVVGVILRKLASSVDLAFLSCF